MNTTIEVRIKIDEKTEITLKSEDAKELYFKLKDIFEIKTEYIQYPFWTPWITNNPIIYTSSSGKFEITNGVITA